MDFGDHVCCPCPPLYACLSMSKLLKTILNITGSTQSTYIPIIMETWSATHTVKMYENGQRSVKPTTNSAGDRKHRLNIEHTYWLQYDTSILHAACCVLVRLSARMRGGERVCASCSACAPPGDSGGAVRGIGSGASFLTTVA